MVWYGYITSLRVHIYHIIHYIIYILREKHGLHKSNQYHHPLQSTKTTKPHITK